MVPIGRLPPKPKENAVARLKRRITDRIEADKDKPRGYRRTQQGLASKIGISKAALNEALNGPGATRGLLAHLDRIADYFGVPPTLLIHANDTSLIELRAAEWRLIQHWRRFSPEVQHNILELYDYFAGIFPEEKDDRRVVLKWRRLNADERETMERTLDDMLRGRRSQPDRDTETAAPGSLPGTRAASGPHE